MNQTNSLAASETPTVKCSIETDHNDARNSENINPTLAVAIEKRAAVIND